MIILAHRGSGWKQIGVEDVKFYDNCMQTAYTDDCAVLVCGCVVKQC